jgi:hypothetical protein
MHASVAASQVPLTLLRASDGYPFSERHHAQLQQFPQMKVRHEAIVFQRWR